MTCKHLRHDAADCVFCERDRLRGELSLAEEGLANATQEIQELRAALLAASVAAQRTSEEAMLALARRAPRT